MAPNYDSVQGQGNSPYGSGDPYTNESAGFISPPKRKGTSPWVKFGIPVLILIIIGAVVGGVVGSRSSKKDDGSSNSSSSDGNSGGAGTKGGEAAASSAASIKAALGRFATATNSEYMIPVYPSTTNAAAFSSPTFLSSSNAALSWPADTFKPSTPAITSVRTDRPRLIAPTYMWEALPALIKSDPYLKGWNDTIFGNATAYAALPPVKYNLDGDSGILDNSREIKMRVKALSYVYRLTKDPKWSDRAWEEIENAASSSFGPSNATKWNPTHFLDTAEMSAAYGIAYDWLYDVLTTEQKTQLRGWLIEYGLSQGVIQLTTSAGWWKNPDTTGNWNCVCNGGLTIASLAILGDDTTGTATQILGLTVDNAKAGCANGPSSDGSWKESPHYWYFGTTGHAEMASALLTATGSHYGLLDTNVGMSLTGKYHMYVTGATSMFEYGDHGPNKYSATANSMFLYAKNFNKPQYSLFQRDRSDAAEPWSMFWYDPTVSGAFWDGTPLDAYFDDDIDQWASMRSSWTASDALYVGVKAGKNQGLQTHNDLDVGTFVIDALGTRWAGELGSGDYLSPRYFSNDLQDSDRWKYYRKMTEGQNTILINQANQNVAAAPTVKYGSSDTAQGSSTVFDLPSGSSAFMTMDMTSAYFSATSVKRGVRLINDRKQILIQDEINAQSAIQWRMHTNATITIDGTTATLALDGKTMKISILSPTSGATISQSAAKRFDTDPEPPIPDQENPGVSVLIISLPAGTVDLQVLFNPQWSGMKDGDFKTPPSVAIDSWSLTSHN